MDPEDRAEMLERNKIRRQMAQASMLLTWVITLSFLAGLFNDTLASRVERVWSPFAVLFPSLMGYIAHYTWLGSRENINLMNKDTQ